jgi:hypothetical protein
MKFGKQRLEDFSLSAGRRHLNHGAFGATPRLPQEIAWPTATDGRALNFLAQVDLASLPTLPGGSPLPRGGTLYFFADICHDACFSNPCLNSVPQLFQLCGHDPSRTLNFKPKLRVHMKIAPPFDDLF